MKEVTQLLEQLASGDPLATDKLLPAVYGELRQLAARALAKGTLGADAGRHGPGA